MSTSKSHPGDIKELDDENPKRSSIFLVEGFPIMAQCGKTTGSNPPQENQSEISQPQRSCNTVRKIVLLAIVTMIVTFITTLALVFTRLHNNEPVEQESDPVNNTKADAARKCLQDLRQVFLLQGIDPFLLSADAPQAMAMEWMAVEDNVCESELNATRLKQRYALLAIYFGTSVNHAISSLVLPGRHECDWVSIGCNAANQVTGIELVRAGGTLVEEIGLLASLTSLRTYESTISGTIPAGLFSLSNLVLLELSGNKMQGNLSSEFGRLSNLEYVNLMSNALTGTLPDSFSSLTKLRELTLDFTSLEGNMMSIICKLPEIVVLSFSYSNIIDTIPTEIGDLIHLTGFYFEATSMAGTIPSEIGLLTSLTLLHGGLTSLQGTLPSEIGHLRFLDNLRVQSADMNGLIPTELGLCSMLTNLEIARNSFSGAVPSELGKLTSLLVIDGEDNAFTGTLPFELGMLSRLSAFRFEGNGRMIGTLPGGLCAVAYDWVSSEDCACCP